MNRERFIKAGGILPLENITGSVPTVDSNHAQIHEGNGFSFGAKFDLAAAGTRYITVSVPAGAYVHYQSTKLASSGPDVLFELLEGVTITAATGTAVTPTNRRRLGTPGASVLTVKDGATVTDDGTTLDTDYIGGGTGVGGSSSGGFSGDQAEWVLKQATDYAIKVTNGGASTATILVAPFWYEQNAG